MDTTSGEATLSDLFCLPFEKGSTLKGNNLLPGSKFFPLSEDSFSEGNLCRKDKQEVTQVISLVNNGRKSTKCIKSH